MTDWKEKTILITGASEGIGRATAIELANRGSKLILAARNLVRLEELKKELSAINKNVQIFSVDVSLPSSVKALFHELPALDMAVNNAGTEGAVNTINYLDETHFAHVFDVNVRGVFLCMKYEIENFLKFKKPGSIINLSSIAGIRGISHSSLYVASKHAVLGLTRALAVEQIQHGIRINCVSPGATDTDMLGRIMGDQRQAFIDRQPHGRLTEPQEIAKAIAWLGSDDASSIVGQDLVIDGGKTVMLP